MNHTQTTFDWTIEYDREATARAVAAIERSGAESCGCQNCRNWIAIRQEAFPEPVRSLFSSLGIRDDRETEIGIPLDTENNTLLYSGYYHFIGRVLNGPAILKVIHRIWPHGPFGKGTVSTMKLHLVDERCSIGFYEKRELLPPSFGNANVVQLEFMVEVPWALSEPRQDT